MQKYIKALLDIYATPQLPGRFHLIHASLLSKHTLHSALLASGSNRRRHVFLHGFDDKGINLSDDTLAQNILQLSKTRDHNIRVTALTLWDNASPLFKDGRPSPLHT
jgi:hypothetical protein